LAALELREGPEGRLTLALSGRLDAYTSGAIWRRATAAVRAAGTRPVVVDASGVEYCDGAGIALLYDLRERHDSQAGPVEVRDLAPQYRTLLDQFPAGSVPLAGVASAARIPFFERVGRAAGDFAVEAREHIVFLGEATAALLSALRHPHRLRWGDALLIAERYGADALPIVALISFLLGVILAFESAVPMRQYGAEIYVADLLGLSVLRELGPLMAAILLAGRSGAAFAAELGTMKINEELNALTTFGLDPVRFLVVTRMLATLVMMPLLAIFADVIGLFGGGFTMLTFGIPPATYLRELQSIVSLTDLNIGLVKSVVYALLISGIGCLRGLQTKSGASAVGLATTRAVVSSIVAIVIADGIFAVMLYYLDL
jgi:phospholipid/cholesterol/gamma-HCH transport system permease protein